MATKRARYGSGRIVKRDKLGNVWQIQWRQNGRYHFQTIRGFKQDAQRELSKRIEQASNPANVSPSHRTFASFADNEWKHYVAENWRASTQSTHNPYVKRIRAHFDSLPLSRIAITDVQSFQSSLRGSLAPKTRKNIQTILVSMVNCAIGCGLIATNPASPINREQRRLLRIRVERKEKPVLEPEQLAALLNAAPATHKALFTLLALSGIRTGEALGLKWADLDWQHNKIHIRRSIWHSKEVPTKTASSHRSKPITPQLGKALRQHKLISHYVTAQDYVFANSLGRPYNPDDLRTVLYKALQAIGIKPEKRTHGLHMLRHSSGSILLQQTGNVKLAQEHLGHASAKTTLDVYMHTLTDATRNAAQSLESAIFAPPKKSAAKGNA